MCATAFLGRTQIRCVSHQRARNRDQLAFVLECNKKIQRCAALINALCQKVKFRGGWEVGSGHVRFDFCPKKDTSEWFHTFSHRGRINRRTHLLQSARVTKTNQSILHSTQPPFTQWKHQFESRGRRSIFLSGIKKCVRKCKSLYKKTPKTKSRTKVKSNLTNKKNKYIHCHPVGESFRCLPLWVHV